MKIYLIRHGQTTGDLENRYGGDYDDNLSDEGKEQSKRLAHKLKQSSIEILFCSPKARAKETANIVANEIGCKIEVVDTIRERNMYGILTGMTKVEAEAKHPKHVEALKNHRHSVPESEDYEQFGERVRKSLKTITAQPYQTVAVLSHGGVIGFIFREILKMGEAKIQDCGFVELENHGDDFSIIRSDGIELA